MAKWLERLALRLVPKPWRLSVAEDLNEEARAERRGAAWRAWQVARVAGAWWWAFGRGAFMSDVRYAVRSLAGNRWFATAAVLTFAVGIGLNIAVFSTVDRLLFRRLPYSDPDRLVLLRSCNAKTGECLSGSFPSPVAFQLQQHSSTIADLAVAGFSSLYMPRRDSTNEVGLSLMDVSPRTLRVLGVRPRVGRDITDDEIARRVQVAWLADAVWRARFNADPDILGRPLWWRDTSATVIGVLPPDFIPPAWTSPNPEWAGLVTEYEGWTEISPTGRILVPFARLKPDATIETAREEVNTLSRRLGGTPRSDHEFISVDSIESSLFSRFRRYLWLVVVAAGLVLAMACANLASLLLARGRSRAHLAAICVALGASRRRLIGTAILESAIVCFLGALAALVVVGLTQKWLAAMLPPLFARYAVHINDLRVIAIALGVASICGMLAGVAPGWKLTRVDVISVLQRGTRSGRRTRGPAGRGMLVVEGALGTVLVIGAVLALQSFAALAHDPLGFAPDDLYVVSLDSQTPVPPDRQLARYRESIDVLRQLPAVKSAGGANSMPFAGEAPQRGFTSGDARGGLYQVTADYFETLEMPFISGRPFRPEEMGSQANVAVLSRQAARIVWPDVPPDQIAGRVWSLTGQPTRQVIGVVEDLKSAYGDAQPRAAAYLPIGAGPSAWRRIVVRTHPGQRLEADVVRARLAERLGDVRVDLRYLPDLLDAELRDPRFRGLLLTALAFAGLLCAAIGLYAVASYDAALRQYEMSVRLTLGATAGSLKRLVLRDVCWPVGVGAGIGLIAAYWGTRFADAFLFKTSGRDPVTYAVVVVVLLATAMAAAWLPARRVSRIDPVKVLKAQ